jgi:DNA-binding winged helix-turn-helix (wHTH) protein
VRVKFAEWTFDPEARELRRGDEPVHVAPKAFDLLHVLIAGRPRVLSKSELMQRIWPDTFVSEATLAALVGDLREIFGGGARASKVLRTAHGVGYAFCADAAPDGTASTSSLCFRVVLGRREIDVPDGEHVMGRSSGCLVWVDAAGVSRRHARLRVSGGRAVIEDLGSKNGTLVDGVAVTGPTELHDGARIGLGSALLLFRAFPSDQSTVPEIR